MKNLNILFLLTFVSLSAWSQQPSAALAASLSGKPVAEPAAEAGQICTITIQNINTDPAHPSQAEYAFAWSVDPVDHLLYLRVNACAQAVHAILIAPDGQHHQHSPRMQVDFRHTFDLYHSPAGTYQLEISTPDGHLLNSYLLHKEHLSIDN